MSGADHKEFSHNGTDQIYHQKTPNSMKFAMLVVSEFFDTPDPEVTRLLQHVVDSLNEPDLPDLDAERMAAIVSDLRAMPLTSAATDYVRQGQPIPEHMLLDMDKCEDITTKLLRYDHRAIGVYGITWSGGNRAVVSYWEGQQGRKKPLMRDLLTFVWRAGEAL